ncbi:type VI immunity family protein [Afifella aestuarii]|uniref:type VI immunity family protein n=1 Tax=Afifella aestuarii TaxID=1909496 RepID=UPI000FE339AC|nr:type VI immunity family protein [Afifella aestuarii]
MKGFDRIVLARLLGGEERLAEVLGPSCPIHDYDGGIVVQAGPEPQLGDINRGLVLDDYRRVSQALAPIRFEDYPRGLFVLGEPFDSLEETRKWIRRFD